MKCVKIAGREDVVGISRDDWRVLEQIMRMRGVAQKKRKAITLQIDINWKTPCLIKRVIPLREGQ